MAHESFEDEEVAKLMNEAFVSIKVDREERPDIDNIYMAVCQMMTGSGGWPLTIIMSPDRKPFFAGTYFPKHGRYGRIGMMELIPKIREYWEKNKNDALKVADKIISTLKEEGDDFTGEELGEEVLHDGYEYFKYLFDDSYGGFGTAPKFPTPHNLMFLFRYWKRTEEGKALIMALKTLDMMALGGIFDHVGFGFHRYSTDSRWLLPHFEKMLYDQALLALAYTEAFQITKKQDYKSIAEKIFTYVLRDMTSEEGGFYSAEDADSEGEEGKFYVWSVEEIEKVLGKEDGEFAAKVFNFQKEGNFKDEATRRKAGHNIIHFKKPLAVLGKELGIDNIEQKVENIRKRLFEEREKRVRPGKDDKILVDWNGLMIAALSKGASVFDNDDYAKAAKKAADFILQSIEKNKKLLHRYCKGEWNFPGNIDDYIFFIWGLLELYEATFEVKYLKKAINIMDECIKNFWDNNNGGFYFTPEGEEVLVRNKEIYDGAVPSGNSVALLNLLKLGRITGNPEYDEKANKLVKAFSKTVSKAPHGYSQFLIGIDFMVGPSYEVVVAGNSQSEDTLEMIKVLRRKFIPNKVVLLNPAEEKDAEIQSIAEYVRYQQPVENKATCYVCKNFACNRPVNDVYDMLSQFE
jgi:uncharacterized protein YyaL (SSP411 family)